MTGRLLAGSNQRCLTVFNSILIALTRQCFEFIQGVVIGKSQSITYDLIGWQAKDSSA